MTSFFKSSNSSSNRKRSYGKS